MKTTAVLGVVGVIVCLAFSQLAFSAGEREALIRFRDEFNRIRLKTKSPFRTKERAISVLKLAQHVVNNASLIKKDPHADENVPKICATLTGKLNWLNDKDHPQVTSAYKSYATTWKALLITHLECPAKEALLTLLHHS